MVRWATRATTLKAIPDGPQWPHLLPHKRFRNHEEIRRSSCFWPSPLATCGGGGTSEMTNKREDSWNMRSQELGGLFQDLLRLLVLFLLNNTCKVGWRELIGNIIIPAASPCVLWNCVPRMASLESGNVVIVHALTERRATIEPGKPRREGWPHRRTFHRLLLPANGHVHEPNPQKRKRSVKSQLHDWSQSVSP